MEPNQSDADEAETLAPADYSRKSDAGNANSEPSTHDAPHNPISELEAAQAQLKDQLLRTAADFDNFRKRSRKDLEETRKKAKEDTLRELFPVFDNLERALAAAEQTTEIKQLVDGVNMVLKLFEDTTNRLGLKRIKSLGEKFDPSIHEAIQQVPSAEHPAGTVVAELVPGYSLDGRLVRAALVAVATAPAEN